MQRKKKGGLIELFEKYYWKFVKILTALLKKRKKNGKKNWYMFDEFRIQCPVGGWVGET